MKTVETILNSENKKFSRWFDDLFDKKPATNQTNSDKEAELTKIESVDDIRNIIYKLVRANKNQQADLDITPQLIQKIREYITQDHYTNLVSLIQTLGDKNTAFTPEYKMFAKIVESHMPTQWYLDLVNGSDFNALYHGYGGKYIVQKFKLRLAHLVVNSSKSATAELIRCAFNTSDQSKSQRIKDIFSLIGVEGTFEEFESVYFYNTLKELKDDTLLFALFVWENFNGYGGLLNRDPDSQGLENFKGLGKIGFENYPNLEFFVRQVSYRDNELALDLILSLWRTKPNNYFKLPKYLKFISDATLSKFLGDDLVKIKAFLDIYFKSKYDKIEEKKDIKEACRILDFLDITPKQVYQLYDSYLKDKPDAEIYFSQSTKFHEGRFDLDLKIKAVKQENLENNLDSKGIANGSEIKLEDKIEKLKTLKALLPAPITNEAEILGIIFVKFVGLLADSQTTKMAYLLNNETVLKELGKFLNGTGLDGKPILNDLEIALLINVLMNHKGFIQTNKGLATVESKTFLGTTKLAPLSVESLVHLLYPNGEFPIFSIERIENILSTIYMGKPLFDTNKIKRQIHDLSNQNDAD